jgi:hypothetical protein
MSEYAKFGTGYHSIGRMIFWTDEQIAEYGNELFDKLVQEEAYRNAEGYDHKIFSWACVPPFPMCMWCFEWRRYPKGQRHFGWAAWMRCGFLNEKSCDCAHHEHEVWMA